MAKLYRSREGSVTAVDTKTQLTSLGSETAPGPLLVPAGSRMLAKVIVSANGDHAAANDATYMVRLEGPGLPEGPETVTAGSSGGAIATGQQHNGESFQLELNIPVTIANEILVFGEMAGEDTGAANIGVTLVFESIPAAPPQIVNNNPRGFFQ